MIDEQGKTEFRIPVSRMIKAAREEVEQQDHQTSSTVTLVSDASAPAVTLSPTDSLPIHYTNPAQNEDEKIYIELSAISDEVLKCRNMSLENIH